jgi:hypothetical protein
MQNYPGLDMRPCQVSQSPYANFLKNKRLKRLKGSTITEIRDKKVNQT